MVSVYYLRDPQTFEIRYVGHSKDVKRRFNEHLAGRGNRDPNVNQWILALLPEDPVLQEVCRLQDKDEACRVERVLLSRLERKGVSLLNNPLPSGHGELTPEHRRKIQVGLRNHHSSSRGAISRQQTADKISQVPRSPEWCKKISEALKRYHQERKA